MVTGYARLKDGNYVCKDYSDIAHKIKETTIPKDINMYEWEQITPSMNKNHGIKADKGKLRLTLVPRKIISAIAATMEYGMIKYKEPDNWKSVEKDRYKDAAFRHFIKYLDDPSGVDEESGLPHLWHLACNIAFLCEMENIDNNI